MGATEAAFATFQAAFAASGDAFAEYCVAMCMVHGFGVGEDDEFYEEGIEMLKRLKGRGDVLAAEELDVLEEES
ncbi:hypothetical protein HDU79_002114 [Rhizoclosmatium sp. JEL0117]|nr:hypothetical protein HDU79_002114 [Rhizoclosmatium sp. JEL0117]